MINNGGGSDDDDHSGGGGKSGPGDGDDDDDDDTDDDVKLHVKQVMLFFLFSYTKYHRHLHGTQLHYSCWCRFICNGDVHGIQGRNRKYSK